MERRMENLMFASAPQDAEIHVQEIPAPPLET